MAAGDNAVVDRVSQDREVLGLTFGWAVIPTLILSIVSFVHPIYSVRYVSASAPAVALLAGFVCVRTFANTLDPARSSDRSRKPKNTNPSGKRALARQQLFSWSSAISHRPQNCKKISRVRQSTQPNIGNRATSSPCRIARDHLGG